MQAGHLGINAHIAHRLQPLEGRADAFGFALGKARGRQGIGAEEFSGDRAAFTPLQEQIDLLLHGEETADLLEERLEGFLREIGVLIAIEAAAALHQFIEQIAAKFAAAAFSQIAADQIQDPVGQQGIEVALEAHPLLLLLAHALQQLDAVVQDLRSAFKAAIAAALLAGLLGREGR